MPRSRTTIALYLFLVFASGILVGVESHRLYATTSTARANSIGEFRRRYLDGMKTQVGVSDTQLTQINNILEDTKKKVDELTAQEKPLHDRIRQEHIDQIRDMLNPEQKIAYDKWREARAAQSQAQKNQSQTQKKN